MAHGAQVIDFVRLRFLNDANQVAGITQVAVVQLKTRIVDVGILVNMINALGIEQAASAFDTMDDVTLFKQKFSEVGTVLAGDTRNEGDFIFFSVNNVHAAYSF